MLRTREEIALTVDAILADYGDFSYAEEARKIKEDAEAGYGDAKAALAASEALDNAAEGTEWEAARKVFETAEWKWWQRRNTGYSCPEEWQR